MNHSQDDEVALFRSIMNGEVLALHHLYRLTHQELFQVACRHLNDKHDAGEVINDVYLDFLNEQRAYNDYQHIRRSLYLKLKWKILNKLKGIRNEQERWSLTDDLSVVSEIEASIEEDIIKNEFYSLIKDKLDLLSPREQMILEEYFFEEKTCPEIARILKVKDSVVYNAKDRAIKKLRAIVSGKNVILILLTFFPPD